MVNEDTFSLLKECDAGVKMATDSLDDARKYASTSEMRALLNTSRQQHEWIGREVEDMLKKCGGKEREPHPMARRMASVKTNVKLTADNSEESIAEIISDGCHMGVKSLYQYLHEYESADEKARDLAKDLIRLEENLADDMNPYL